MKDPFDDHILELALAAESDYIITFDVKDFERAGELGVRALRPGEFLKILEEEKK